MEKIVNEIQKELEKNKENHIIKIKEDISLLQNKKRHPDNQLAKIGRNSPCSYDSNLKFKKCCGF